MRRVFPLSSLETSGTARSSVGASGTKSTGEHARSLRWTLTGEFAQMPRGRTAASIRLLEPRSSGGLACMTRLGRHLPGPGIDIRVRGVCPCTSSSRSGTATFSRQVFEKCSSVSPRPIEQRGAQLERGGGGWAMLRNGILVDLAGSARCLVGARLLADPYSARAACVPPNSYSYLNCSAGSLCPVR